MLVLLVIGLLTVLGVALTLTTVMNSQNTVSSDQRERAYNTAESGMADVMTQLGNNSIGSGVSGTWQNNNAFPSQQDTFETYDYNVTFNNGSTPIVVQDPLTTTGATCGAQNPNAPSPGCVALAPNGVFIAVRGHYNGHQAYAEGEAIDAVFTLGGNTIFTKNNAGTNGNGAIASDPCDHTCPQGVSASHNVEVYTDGSFNGGKGLIDGNVNSVGTATANVPNGCSPSCTATSGAAALPFPSSNDIVQAENTWKLDAIRNGHYYSSTATLPSTIDVASGSTWFIDQSVDLKNVAITNEGGLVVVTGAITESGNKTAANYSLSSTCNSTCKCHGEAQLVSLSTGGIQLHGQGTGGGNLVSQGLLFAPNGPVTNIGNAAIQAAIIASSAQIGGNGGMTADACAAGPDGAINTYGYNISSYGEH
jgi:hypothetical protein